MDSISKINERNQRVEIDKAWEISWTRRLLIMAITYMTASLFLISIEASSPWLSALVPTGGYLLSTLSLKPIKTLWIKAKRPS